MAILDRLSQEILALSENKAFRARLEVTGADLVFHMKPAEFETYLQNQRETLGKIARDNNMKEE